MHIALMATGGNQWLGGSQYIKSIAHSLHMLSPERRNSLRVSVVVSAGFDPEHFADLRGIVDRVIDAEPLMAPYSIANRVRWKLRRMAGRSVNPRLEDFLTAENVGFAYPCRLRRNWTDTLRFAAWIPDFQYHYFPDGSNPEEVAGRKADAAFITANYPRVVLSSAVAEDDCHRLFPDAKGKTFVLRFRVWIPDSHIEGSPGRTLEEFHLPERFFILSNLFAPTKNHRVVFEALGLLARKGCRPVVVCTGNIHDYRNPDFASSIFHSINRNGVNEQVRLLGIIPKPQQLQLMRQAVAVLQPSLFEGWSTPVEESRCLGKPLLVSDLPIHREQDAPNALYFDPRSPESLAQVLQDSWESHPAGVNSVREGAARANYAVLVRSFAETFLRLAQGQPQ